MAETAVLEARSQTLAAPLVVLDKFTGATLAELPQLTAADADDLIREGQAATAVAAALPRHERARILDDAAQRLSQREDVAARLIVAEAGKTIRQARREVARAVNTLRLSATQARSNVGEVVPFDGYAAGAGRQGWFTREPLGLVLAITPYNDPLNLVAHKLGPAIAGGNAVILKPSQLTPLSARFLVDLLVEAGLPEPIVTVAHGDRHLTQALVRARQVRMVSFTGGFATGEAIAASAGVKRLEMELGGNAPVLVFEDADLDAAVTACVSGAFWAAGQNCIGVQRILVHRSIQHDFTLAVADATRVLVAGDPTSESTDVGPMISAQAAAAALATVDAAVAEGALLLTGGRRRGSVLAPTVLAKVPRTARLWREEAFAPVVAIVPFDTEDEAVALANDSEFALQAGVFTRDIDRALRVAGRIEAGGVMINDSSDVRLDAMPFGGSKYGSMGREGVRFAYEAMTQPKVIAITHRASSTPPTATIATTATEGAKR